MRYFIEILFLLLAAAPVSASQWTLVQSESHLVLGDRPDNPEVLWWGFVCDVKRPGQVLFRIQYHPDLVPDLFHFHAPFVMSMTLDFDRRVIDMEHAQWAGDYDYDAWFVYVPDASDVLTHIASSESVSFEVWHMRGWPVRVSSLTDPDTLGEFLRTCDRQDLSVCLW